MPNDEDGEPGGNKMRYYENYNWKNISFSTLLTIHHSLSHFFPESHLTKLLNTCIGSFFRRLLLQFFYYRHQVVL